MKGMLAWVRRVDYFLVGILVVGLALRLWGIGFGLPYLYHPDENVPVSIALRILQTGDWNPGFFNWPSLLIYLNAVGFWFFFILGRLAGHFNTPADMVYPDLEAMAVGKAALPEELLLGRGLAVLFGVLCVLTIFVICRDVFPGRGCAWFSALLLAVDPILVRNNQFIRPDTFAVFFSLLSVLFALRIIDEPSPRNYVLAGIGAGLATSSKYNLGFVVIPILVAHFIRFGAHGFYRKEIYLSGLTAMGAFFLTTPYSILDWQRFIQIGPFEDANIYSTGHPGAEGDSLLWYLSFFLSYYGVALFLAVAEVVRVVITREAKGIVLLSFPAIYFVFINLYTVHFETTAMPVIPFLILFASLFLFRMLKFAIETVSLPRALVGTGMGIAATLLVAFPLYASAANNIRITTPDGREIAREWIDTNLPPGSRIALESYSPYLDPKKFVVEGFYGLQDHSPDWYLDNGFEYLVFSEGTFGRYFADPARYIAEVNRYNLFFTRFVQVASFDRNGVEVRIYKTGAQLPSHRVATRFGDDRNLVELVGYEVRTFRLSRGESLPVTLYWRTLGGPAEPLELHLRLVGKDGKVVEELGGDLFQGAGWIAGITSKEWTIQPPADLAPGQYDLQIEVIQSRYDYRPSITNWHGDKLQEVSLGPFTSSPPPPSADELRAAEPSNIEWTNKIALLGYLPPPTQARAGESLPLTVYWQTRDKLPRDYTVFIHLLNVSGQVRAQMDTQPRNATYPTSVWEKDEIIRDDYSIKLPADLGLGTYRIEIGWYEFPSLSRFEVVDPKSQERADSYMLPEIVNVIP